ncbi:hypothetical protein IVB04_32255 [Bradyrhizobium sp. 169]|nr:hypothetical protein [Bradyrhizobium sp. 169]
MEAAPAHHAFKIDVKHQSNGPQSDAYDKGKARRIVLRFLEQRVLTGSEQAQVIRPAAFHEAQKVRVIHNLAEHWFD